MPGHDHPKRRIRRARITAILLVLLVVVPGLVLGWMAIQATGREEAVIEKQLRTALLAEVTPAADRVAALLTELAAELSSAAPDSVAAVTPAPDAAIPALAVWADSTRLIGIPFLFQRSTARFLWPAEQASVLPESEASFLDLNLDFFQDRKSVEVYQNVAIEYADQMEKKGKSAETVSEVDSKAARRQQALSDFENDAQFREKLYDEAERSGKNVPERAEKTLGRREDEAVAVPSPSRDRRTAVRPPSPFVTESLRFSQIVRGADQGWIPRLIDDRLELLFWKKVGPDRILGCSVDEGALRDRILAVLPVARNEARVLVVLDGSGRPIFDPASGQAPSWRIPFVSREISEFLPRWTVAAYLTDPGVIADRARTRSLAIGLLVGVLVVSIMAGGFAVSWMLRSELRLAEQKTTFVANVSHELKTPLTSIRLLSEMLRDGRHQDEAKRRQYLDIVVSEAERLTRLINNVLDFSRQHREERQYVRRRVDLVELAREILESQQVRLEHQGFTVESVFDTPAAPVLADPEAIKQAILNLLSNAEKYSPGEKWIRFGLRVDREDAVLSVADHGIGIRPLDAQRIFDEFYRADDSLTASVRGTGLGLTLSRRIAQDHGGTINYSPNEPEGSRFELRLPLNSVEDPDA
ncbi:MAG: HAMP domain-containing histidine kinase [Candidatus Eisenbacteria bacterium]|uniref:histidine kinase n=1 Tax=Eiseniibacteriota bacterium TaxID=2212470 RepID=A0A956M261_UNCEI|nr:HAMP domain-containing histidine kinase [Candidatus Eisenbacteria bacterium]